MTSCFISLYIRQYIIIIATRQQGARIYSTYSGWYSALSYKRKLSSANLIYGSSHDVVLCKVSPMIGVW